jgi:membrane protein
MPPSNDAAIEKSSGVPRGNRRSWTDFGRELFHSISTDDLFGRSAQLAYYFFFAVFPGFIFLSALLAMLSGSSTQSSLMAHLPRVVPPAAFHVIRQTFTETTNGSGKMTFGALVALWSATAGMAAACDTLNAVHDVSESRPYWKVRLIALGLTIVAMLLLLGAIAALFSGNTLINLLPDGVLRLPLTLLIRAAAWMVAFLLVGMIFALVYFLAPDVKERKWHWITPGATVGIVLWIVATIGLRVYLHFSHSFSVTYGSLGAVIVLLTWFYIGGFALLLGAEINTVNEDAAAQEGDPKAKAKGEKQPEAG